MHHPQAPAPAPGRWAPPAPDRRVFARFVAAAATGIILVCWAGGAWAQDEREVTRVEIEYPPEEQRLPWGEPHDFSLAENLGVAEIGNIEGQFARVFPHGAVLIRYRRRTDFHTDALGDFLGAGQIPHNEEAPPDREVLGHREVLLYPFVGLINRNLADCRYPEDRDAPAVYLATEPRRLVV